MKPTVNKTMHFSRFPTIVFIQLQPDQSSYDFQLTGKREIAVPLNSKQPYNVPSILLNSLWFWDSWTIRFLSVTIVSGDTSRFVNFYFYIFDLQFFHFFPAGTCSISYFSLVNINLIFKSWIMLTVMEKLIIIMERVGTTALNWRLA